MTRVFEFIMEVFNWLKIAASPTLIGLALGTVFYTYKPDMTGIIFGGLIFVIGLAIGIYLALKVSKHVGATEYMFKINETPDIDERWKDKKESKS